MNAMLLRPSQRRASQLFHINNNNNNNNNSISQIIEVITLLLIKCLRRFNETPLKIMLYEALSTVYVIFIPFGDMKIVPSEILAVRIFYNHQQTARFVALSSCRRSSDEYFRASDCLITYAIQVLQEVGLLLLY
jgi:hypothetical protein